MFAEVIPLVRLPRALTFFDYRLPVPLEHRISTGAVVHVPFRGALVRGIVQAVKRTTRVPTTALKSIVSLVDTPPLTATQLSFARWFARYHFISLALSLRQLVRPFEERTVTLPTERALPAYTPQTATARRLVRLVTTGRRVVIRTLDENDRIDCYRSLGHALLSRGRQVLLLAPNVRAVAELTAALAALAPVTLTSEEKRNALRTVDALLRSGRPTLVVATRSGCFAPFRSLGLIIIDSEDDPSHKQAETNPRFNAVVAAEALADTTGAGLVALSACPTLVTFHKVKEAQYSSLESRRWLSSRFRPTVVNLLHERTKAHHGELSDTLSLAIGQALARRRHAFLFVNRRGFATRLICRDCSYQALCPRCSAPQVVHTLEGTSKRRVLRCHRCTLESPISLTCPSCGGTHLTMLGRGSERLIESVRRLFPKVPLRRIDTDVTHPVPAAVAGVTVGTLAALPHVDGLPLGAVGVVDADTLLYRPDYHSSEQTFATLMRLSALAAQAGARCIIQSSATDHPAIRAVSRLDYRLFATQELATRRRWGYPPYRQLVKVLVPGSSRERCLARANKLVAALGAHYETYGPTLARPTTRSVRAAVVFKADERDSLHELNGIVPPDCLVDRDPASVL